MPEKKGLEEIIDSERVYDDPVILKDYSKSMSFVHPVMPQLVVRPTNAEEVQAVVQWANETGTALVPVSSGPPHFRGDTVPSLGGVVVDVSGMKKVVRVDKRNRMAIIEPGVTFNELQDVLKKEGLRLNMPLLARSSKSVIASMLEREPVMMPKYQWDALDPLSCAEIVFGSGVLFRTGAAAGPATLERQWEMGQAQTHMQGPGQVDFCRLIQGAQGTMGIVTWASLRCELLPLLQSPFLVGSESYEKIAEFVQRLLYLKLVDECLVMTNSDMAAIMAKQWPEEYRSIKDDLPPWVLYFSIGGCEGYLPEEKVAYQEKDMVDAAKEVGLEPARGLAGISAFALSKKLCRASEEPYWKTRLKGGFQDIFFLTTLDKVPKFVDLMYRAATEHGYPTPDIGVYVQPMVQGTNCHCEFTLFFNSEDSNESARVQSLSVKASEALMNEGAFFSRPYANWADLVYRRDSATASVLKKIKGIFDENNIMNPGKLCF